MDDERVLRKFLGLEMGRIHQGLVRSPRPLRELLAMDAPELPTRGGEPYRFDRAALERLQGELSPLTRAELRLPIMVYKDHRTPGDCFVADRAAITALHELDATPTEPRDGKLWIGEPLVRDFARRWPTVVQFVVR